MRRWFLPSSISLLLVAVLVPALAHEEGRFVPRVAMLARDDVPFDSLGAGAIAGHMGGVVCITSPTALSEEARSCVRDFAPNVLVVAGGEAAIAQHVAEAAAAECEPDCIIDRRGGAGRDATAYELSRVPQYYAYERPVLTGAAETIGDVHLGGTIEVADLAIESEQLVENLNADRLDGLHAEDLVARETVSDAFACAPRAFHPARSDVTFDTGSTKSDPAPTTEQVPYLRAGESAIFTCPMSLPDGAVITRITAALFDDSSSAEAGGCVLARFSADGRRHVSAAAIEEGTGDAFDGGVRVLTGGPLGEPGNPTPVTATTRAHELRCALDSGTGIVTATVDYVAPNVPAGTP